MCPTLSGLIETWINIFFQRLNTLVMLNNVPRRKSRTAKCPTVKCPVTVPTYYINVPAYYINVPTYYINVLAYYINVPAYCINV